jgi:hypothetical protein
MQNSLLNGQELMAFTSIPTGGKIQEEHQSVKLMECLHY